MKQNVEAGSVVALVLLSDGLLEPLFEQRQLGDEVGDGVPQGVRWAVIRRRLKKRDIVFYGTTN